MTRLAGLTVAVLFGVSNALCAFAQPDACASATMTTMATKQRTSTRRAAPQNGQIAAGNGWRSRVHTPTETDPKKRAQAIRQAASRIKTTARIDTITLGRD